MFSIYTRINAEIQWPHQNSPIHTSLKGGCTPKVQQNGNWKGHFSFVTKTVIIKLISLDLVGISLSSSTQKALLNCKFNFNFICRWIKTFYLTDCYAHYLKWHTRNPCINFGGCAMMITRQAYFQGILATPGYSLILLDNVHCNLIKDSVR